MKVYLHAVIDNFSRRILAWRLAERLDPTTTCEVLVEAGRAIGCVPTVVADSGVENVNGQVDALVKMGVLRRILALVEVAFSNSMIEAWWDYSSDCALAVSDRSKSVGSSSRIRIRKPFARPRRT